MSGMFFAISKKTRQICCGRQKNIPDVFSCCVGAAAFALGMAQGATGAISGRITDSAGGAIPGVTISVLFGIERGTAVTSSQGWFSIDNLLPGRYEVQARLAGFETEIETNVTVVAGSTLSWNRTLRVRSGRSSEPPAETDPTPPALARAIFEAVLRHVYKPEMPERPVIETVSLVPVRPDAQDWQVPLLGAPPELRALLEVPENRRPVWLNAASLPAATQLVPRATISDVFRTAPKTDRYGGWETFRARYGVSSYLSLSRAIITADGRDALVYFEHRCGSLCGEGTLLWLRRIPADGPWTVRGRRLFWIS